MASTHVQPVPGKTLPGILGTVWDLVAFKRGWKNYFVSRRERADSDIYRSRLGTPAVTILDAQTIRILFDTTRVMKRYGIGPFIPPRPLVGGITPTIFLNDSDHTAQKAFWIACLKARGPDLVPRFCDTLRAALTRWQAQGSFAWGPEIDRLFADFLFAWLLDTQAPVADLEAWLTQIFARRQAGGAYRAAEAAYGRLRSIVQHAPRFGEMAALGAQFNMSTDVVASNLLFTLGFNAWAGLAGLARSLIAELTVQVPARQALTQAAAGHPGGDMAAWLGSAPATGCLHFVLEVLRLHPPVNLIYAEARDNLVLESRGKAYSVQKGELLMGAAWFAHRDSTVFAQPDAFMPERFADPALRTHLIWANGPDDTLPQATNKMCPGRDVVVLLMQILARELTAHCTWELGTVPHFSTQVYPRAGAPSTPLDVTRFSYQP